MGARARAVDWSKTPLGPAADWPQSLRTAVGIVLNSLHPMFLAWGDALIFIYNDAYAPILGARHPDAVGRPFQDIWPEIWPDIWPLVERALAGESTWSEDLHLVMERNGYPEDTWYTFSYSPIFDEAGGVGGMFCACTETTGKVLTQRRMQFQIDLGEALRDLTDPVAMTLAASALLGDSLGASRVGYGEVDAAEIVRVPRDWSAEGEAPGAPGTPRPLAAFGAGFLEDLRRGVTVRVDDTAADPRAAGGRDAYEAVSARAIVVVPLVRDGRLKAVFYVHQSTPRTWSGADVGLAEDVAQRTWSALERAMAEAALGRQASEENERLRRLFAQAPSFIAVLRGPDHVFELANDAFLRLVGDRPLVGLAAREALPETSSQGFFELLDAAYASGEPFFASAAPLDLQRTAGGGMEQRFVDFVYQPVLGADGAVSGIFVDGSDVTERIVATSALRDSEARLRLAMHAARMGEVTFHLDADSVTHSAGFAALLGFSPDRRLTLDEVRSRYHPDDVERVARERAAILVSAEPFYDVEHRVVWPDGSVHWLYGRGEVIHDEAGRTTVTAVYIDVTAQKSAEAALRESEDHYRHAVELNPQVAWTAGPDGQLDRIAERWMDWTGTDALGSAWREAIHPHDIDATVEAWTHSVATGERYDVEHRLRMADGGYLWMRSRAFPRLDESGAIVKWYGAIENIHERKTAESRLRDSETQFRTLAQAMPNHVWAARSDGLLDWVNDKVYEYSGGARGVLDGASWDGLLHPDDRAGAVAAWSHAVSTGETYECEFRIRRADGAYRWHIARALPIHDIDGVLLRWIGTNTDIEEQKAGVEELSRLNATLETRVEERSRELRTAEEALRQAQKMEAVGQLTGGIAHDFNNLLTGIIGSLDIVRRRLASGRAADADRFIDAAVTSASRAAGLTHRLLAFSRRQSLDSKPIEVDVLVRSMEDLLRRTLGENIALTIRSPPHPWIAEADANQLESALLNLAINARDAMPDGGLLTVEVANLRLHDAAEIPGLAVGDYVAMSVSDTGSGMDETVLERAFDPFFTTKPIGQGTGLGLSMIYGFAKQSNGHVRLASELGQGATVTIYLPRYRGEAAEQVQDEHPAVEGRARDGETVLVVEDDAAVRMLVVEVLQELGYDYLEAVDGKSAVPVLQSGQRIDLLVSDVGLPGMNGRQLAEIARQTRPRLKVLFITGYAENAAVRGGFLEPGMEMVAKPFALDALAAKISQMLQPD